MKKQRRKHSAEFKAQVALERICGTKTLSEIARDYEIHPVMVGTLFNRNMHKTIEGFAKFYRAAPNAKKTRYTIIGSGPGDEIEQLRRLTSKYNLHDVIHILGHIPHDQLQQYFESHNVGISYVPMTEYFDVQPVTKTFEYLLSGLAVLGTATSENKLVVNESNGILTGDSVDDFCNGLVQLSKKMGSFRSKQIRKNAMQFSWEKITDNLDLYLGSLMDA